MPSNATVLIFDLDHCLFNTHDLGGDFLDAVIAPLTPSMDEQTIACIQKALWRTPFDMVLSAFAIPDTLAEHMRIAWLDLRVPPHVKPYKDVVPVLTRLRTAGNHLALVTRGYQHLQQSKIDVLGIAPLFRTCIIVSPESVFPDKRAAFEHILEATEHPSHVHVIGDGPEEIAAGNALRATTIQTLRPTVVHNEAAQYHVHTLTDLLPLL